MPVVFILLDAFRQDYLSEETTPFLWRCSQQGKYYKYVIPNLGFCERTEILTGLTPDESGFFTAIGYDPENSPFRNKKILLYVAALIERMTIWFKLQPQFRRRAQKFIKKFFSQMGIYQIPFTILPYFSLTEDLVDHRQPHAFSSPSLLTLLDRQGRKYFYDSFTSLNTLSVGDDQDRINNVLKVVRGGDYDFYLLYISTPDSAGHKFGPNSPQLREKLKSMDSQLEKFSKSFMEKKPKTKFVFLGDHGMVPVKKHFNGKLNLENIFKDLKLGKDYLFFLDSTIIRVWFFSDRARSLRDDLIKSSSFLENGFFLDAEMASDYRVPNFDRRYGDVIWIAKKGVLVSPDFFHGEVPPRGMHGYIPTDSDSWGTGIVWSAGSTTGINQEQIFLQEIFGELKKLLRLYD